QRAGGQLERGIEGTQRRGVDGLRRELPRRGFRSRLAALRRRRTAELVEIEQAGAQIRGDERPVAELGFDGALDGLAVGRDLALVADRRWRPSCCARHGERAVDARRLAFSGDIELAEGNLLDRARYPALRRDLAESIRRGGARDLEHRREVGRIEVESDVEAAQRPVEVDDVAAHGEARAAQVRDRDVVERDRPALQRQVGLDAADRLLVVDRLAILSFSPIDGPTDVGALLPDAATGAGFLSPPAGLAR